MGTDLASGTRAGGGRREGFGPRTLSPASLGAGVPEGVDPRAERGAWRQVLWGL